jgi:hypothetical protein
MNRPKFKIGQSVQYRSGLGPRGRAANERYIVMKARPGRDADIDATNARAEAAFTGPQIRAARLLLGWSQFELSRRKPAFRESRRGSLNRATPRGPGSGWPSSTRSSIESRLRSCDNPRDDFTLLICHENRPPNPLEACGKTFGIPNRSILVRKLNAFGGEKLHMPVHKVKVI